MIGLGAIGGQVLDAIESGALPGVSVPAVLVRRPRPPANRGPLITNDPERFFAHPFDAVLEGAGHESVRDHGERILDAGADLLVTSVGALADDLFRERLMEAARRNHRRLILPSAGIGALDILAGAAVGGLDHVEIVVRKQPEAWKGTPGETLVDLDRLTAPATLYEGPVREGAKAYPKNVNISAAVALAGIGLDRTRLTIVADPTITSHVVEVHARGAFGRFDFVEDVVPTADNPKTGMLVGMAVIKAVRQLTQPMVIGL
ncbi:MAG: aspartate dehydrogenase [Proteobacteria bacterium]|nr:aspartate dehydrogenase [Pseudomonadota bacterium]MBI3496770.1 aspartate dehydrogenase [Pseudomonadota bacterium]